MLRKSIGDRMLVLRLKQNKSIEECAESIMKFVSDYEQMEKGKLLPTLKDLKYLSDYFNVSPEYIIGLTNIPTKHAVPDIDPLEYTVGTYLCSMRQQRNLSIASVVEGLNGLVENENDYRRFETSGVHPPLDVVYEASKILEFSMSDILHYIPACPMHWDIVHDIPRISCERIKNVIKSSGYTYGVLMVLLEYRSVSSIYNLANHRIAPALKHYFYLAQCCNISLDYLLNTRPEEDTLVRPPTIAERVEFDADKLRKIVKSVVESDARPIESVFSRFGCEYKKYKDTMSRERPVSTDLARSIAVMYNTSLDYMTGRSCCSKLRG